MTSCESDNNLRNLITTKGSYHAQSDTLLAPYLSIAAIVHNRITETTRNTTYGINKHYAHPRHASRTNTVITSRSVPNMQPIVAMVLLVVSGMLQVAVRATPLTEIHDIGSKDCMQLVDEYCRNSTLSQCPWADESWVPLDDVCATSKDKAWRCYSPACLDPTHSHYMSGSGCTKYCSRDAEIKVWIGATDVTCHTQCIDASVCLYCVQVNTVHCAVSLVTTHTCTCARSQTMGCTRSSCTQWSDPITLLDSM